jgi:hypothetical protein
VPTKRHRHLFASRKQARRPLRGQDHHPVVETRHRARTASVLRTAACAITPTSVSPGFDAANSVSVLMVACLGQLALTAGQLRLGTSAAIGLTCQCGA